jgi:hypothetical protein
MPRSSCHDRPAGKHWLSCETSTGARSQHDDLLRVQSVNIIGIAINSKMIPTRSSVIKSEGKKTEFVKQEMNLSREFENSCLAHPS